MTTTTESHDSLTCSLDKGRACGMCYWANTRHGLVECPGCWQWVAMETGHVCGESAEPSLLTEEEVQLVISAIPLQALPDQSDIRKRLSPDHQTMFDLLAYPNSEGLHQSECRHRDFERALVHALQPSTATIRAALFDVIDKGYQCDKAGGLNRGELTECDLFHPWRFSFDVPEIDEENLQRQRFVDAVIERVNQLQRPPHSFDATLNNYQSGYADGWAAAHTATLREQNADLREMLRLARVRRGR